MRTDNLFPLPDTAWGSLLLTFPGAPWTVPGFLVSLEIGDGAQIHAAQFSWELSHREKEPGGGVKWGWILRTHSGSRLLGHLGQAHSFLCPKFLHWKNEQIEH